MELRTLNNNELEYFKKEMQEAFQKGYEDKFGKTKDLILPEGDIMESLSAPHSVALEVVEDGITECRIAYLHRICHYKRSICGVCSIYHP